MYKNFSNNRNPIFANTGCWLEKKNFNKLSGFIDWQHFKHIILNIFFPQEIKVVGYVLLTAFTQIAASEIAAVMIVKISGVELSVSITERAGRGEAQLTFW